MGLGAYIYTYGGHPAPMHLLSQHFFFFYISHRHNYNKNCLSVSGFAGVLHFAGMCQCV